MMQQATVNLSTGPQNAASRQGWGWEATGVYSLPFALALHESKLIEVMVINPKAVKHFATAKLQRGKTDSLDAQAILEYVELIEQLPELNESLRLIASTTGIAHKTGPRILAELAALPDDMTGAQWVAHAGLDPRPYELGSSTNKL